MNKIRFRPTMRAVAVALLSLGLLSGCQKTAETGAGDVIDRPAASSTPATVPQVSLTPGKVQAGVGFENVKLGQTKAEVVKALGDPEEVDANEFAPGQTYALYYSKGIELSYSNDKLEVITLHSPVDKWMAYTGATEQGLGVGSSADEIIKALGEPAPDAPRALRYPKLGVWFRLDADRTPTGGTPRAESMQLMKPE